MAEVEYYNRERFPFAGIFGDLTEQTNRFELSALTAYCYYQRMRQSRELRPGADYCSTSITSGGHARVPGKETVVEDNTRNARQLLGELAMAGAVYSKHVILPADFGKVPHWRQSDFISLWLSVISGINIDESRDPDTKPETDFFARILARELEEASVDLQVMNDSAISAADRAPEYFKFAGAFATVADYKKSEAVSAHRVINLIDPWDSLGSRTEHIFAHTLDIPVYDVEVVGCGPNAADAIKDISLRIDLDEIVRYGGTSIQLLPGNHFRLRQATETPKD